MRRKNAGKRQKDHRPEKTVLTVEDIQAVLESQSGSSRQKVQHSRPEQGTAALRGNGDMRRPGSGAYGTGSSRGRREPPGGPMQERRQKAGPAARQMEDGFSMEEGRSRLFSEPRRSRGKGQAHAGRPMSSEGRSERELRPSERARQAEGLRRRPETGEKRGREASRMAAARPKSRTGSFVVQGTILAAAGIIVRLIGLLYRIPMTNIIGDEGMGYYSTAFNVYNIVLILSSYSLPLAVSKLVSARLAKGEFRNASRVLCAALVYATCAGGVACGVVWHFGSFFAGTVFKTPFCVYALRTLAPTIWIMAYLGVLRGYFQGHGTMIPTAVSQIFEQIVNAAISVTAAGVLFKVGLDSNRVFETTGYPEAFGAAGGTIGTGAGALTALLFMLFLFAVYRPFMKKKIRRDRQGSRESYGHISGVFFMTVMPVILSSAVYNINAVLDNSIMAYGMDALGRGEEFLALWGIYNNKYLLLVHVPLAMANALSSSLIPSLAAAVARKQRGEAARKTGMAIRFSMVIAIPAAVGLTVLAEPVNRLLFHSGDTAEAVRMMVWGSSAIVFLSLSTVMNAILQGLGHMNLPVRHAAAALVLHVAALYVMLMGLHWGIYSVLFANILFAVIICLLNWLSIRRILHYRQELKRTFIIPLAASAVMGAAAYGCYQGLSRLFGGSGIATVGAVLAGVLVYGILLLKIGGVDAQELQTMPGGTRILKTARKLRILQ